MKSFIKKAEDFNTQIYIVITSLIGMFVHIFLAFYFFALRLDVVAWVNIFDIFLWNAAFLFAMAGRTRIASSICVFTLIFYSLVGTYLLGTGVNVQWTVLTALVPTALFFDFSKRERIYLISLILLVLNVQLFIGEFFEAPYLQNDNIFLQVFLGNIVVLAIIIELFLDMIIRSRLGEVHKKELEDFKNMSYIDPLTNLNNRRYSEVFFKRLIRDELERSYCFALLDIDDFKKINDTYGHNVGDVVLEKLGEILRENTRQTDLVCRWGGEEFLLILSTCDISSGYIALEHIRKAVEQTVVLTSGHEINFTITAGAAVWHDEGIEKTLDICDKNLYKGKKSGKNKVVI